ncbi:MAG TPA: hormogonium polysaccharide biosynthesis protein HpsA [Coleofasciculaceae cyanobacterium]
MSTPKIIRATQHLLQQISRMARTLTKGLVSWLLRNWLIFGRRSAAQAGFVLPTTILLLLVVTLTVGSIGYRTFTRSQQTIGERRQRVIYNAATPAIDRAKSKIEFLFDPDRDRRSGGVPSQTQLLGMMLNDGRNLGTAAAPISIQPNLPGGVDPYKLPDESRIDINGDGVLDNAWRYKADLDGDGTTNGANDGTVVYSILFTAPDAATLRSQNVNARATARPIPLVRNAPLSNATQSTSACQIRSGSGAGQFVPINADGWFPDEVNTTKLRKNFQVDAYVLPNNPNGTVATLEFQQDREATQGFKWAAWFRNDLEIFPGPAFNWNGAMHTEGNMIVGGGTSFRGYMISSKSSCLYDEEASKLTTADVKADTGTNVPAFQGQFITGTIRDNDYSGGPRFDLFTSAGNDPTQNQTMDSNSDSITPTNSRKPADYSLDPVSIQANGVSIGRTVPNPAVDRDAATPPIWDDTNKFKKRMAYAQQDTPYVDDTFRADNRYGPYPRFGRKREQIPGFIGADIAGNIELTGDDPPPGSDSTSVGLDGYWERRARREGLRLIVGQRLELGDLAGWGGPSPDGAPLLENEPLKPWEFCPNNSSNRCNEARQRKSLWDNLSSVQATAVYHAKSPNGVDFPAACLATTVHPGTAGTLDKSATFENLAYGLPVGAFPTSPLQEPYLAAGGRSLITSDFLRGRGTNGWEFSPPPTNAFTSNAATNPWMNALRNLSQFAGDPNGGAPSFTPVQDAVNQDVVHPYPRMAMWGDFSMLRRVIGLMDNGVSYANLSPADKTTLHTAGCLIGMLAYNLDYLEKFDLNAVAAADPNLVGVSSITNPSSANFSTGLRGTLRLILRRNDAAVLALPAATRLPESIRKTGLTSVLDAATLEDMAFEAGSNDPETFVRLMERWRDDPTTSAARRDELTKQIYLAQIIISKEQVAHDRRYGFFSGRSAEAPLGQCKVWEASVVAAGGTPEASRANSEPLFSLCSKRPHFPVLYSLFPALPTVEATPPATVEAGYLGGFKSHKDLSDGTQSGVVRDADDSSDDYIRRSNTGASIVYRVVRPEAVASKPLGVANTLLGSTTPWTLPVEAAGNGSTPNSNQNTLIKLCLSNTPCSQPTSSTSRIPKSGALYRVAFKDAALFNGREMLSVRTLDLNLDFMRSQAISDDFWLPKSGLVYGFREDAVSEAHIVRPYRNTWDNCKTDMKLRTEATCQMNTGTVSAVASTDPPLSSDRKISTKPVDYYADPDRRPHGFRLRNGASLGRAGDDGRGLSFVSHNPAYVMGYFNLHRAPGVTSTARDQGLEEFVAAQRLETTNFSNFYSRSDLDLNFARPATDQWRPSEVLADAVTPLSTEFCDGTVEDGMFTGLSGDNLLSNQARDRYGCTTTSNITSYFNQNRPNTITPATKGIKWMRASLADSYPPALPDALISNPAEGESPIFFPRGNPFRFNNDNPREYTGGYVGMNSNKSLIDTSSGIQMNMIMVSGLVPSRPNQSYGGLHNFPRFIENWGSADLFMSGAFLQLSFSTYATSPFDQDRWEVSTLADGTTSEDIKYYSPPNRRWGYDVGLQYAKAGPVAERFKFAEAIRSEFYTEPAANDPYIATLSACARPATCSAP